MLRLRACARARFATSFWSRCSSPAAPRAHQNRADELVDRAGRDLPVGLSASASANVFGVAGLYDLAPLHTTVGAAVSMPVARVSLSPDDPRASLDDFGGGAGAHFARVVALGGAGYALWQVTDDGGSALPPVLAGARDVDYGLGPEVDVTVPALRAKVTARYTHDLLVRSRPSGEVVVIAIGVSAWRAR